MNPGLSFRQRVRFAFWLARADLYEAAARPTSRVILITLAVLTATALLALGLPFVAEKIRLQRLRDNPLSLCLWVGDRPLGRKLDPAFLETVRGEVVRRLDRPEDLVGCHGFYEVDFGFRFRTGEGPFPLRGRTLGPGDPMFRDPKKLLSDGAPFERPDQPGLIVSPRLLLALDYPPETPVGTVLKLVAARGGAVIDVPIVGKTHDPLPLGYYFVVNEAEELRLQTEDPDDPVPHIGTGFLGPGWPENPNKLPGDHPVRRALAGWQVTAFPDLRYNPAKRADEPTWKLRAGKDIRRSQWNAYLAQLEQLMTAAGAAPAPEFVRVIAPPPGALAPPPPRPGYDKLAVYVRDLPALRPAQSAVVDQKLLVMGSVIGQLEEISNAALTARRILWVLLGIFTLIAFLNIHAVLGLRARQKAAEIGMLRAMGMGPWTLLCVAVAEGLLLWSRGTLYGLILAAAPAAALGYAYVRSDEVGLVLDGWWPWLGLIFLAVSLLLCMFSAWRAGADLRNQSPVTSLGLTG